MSSMLESESYANQGSTKRLKFGALWMVFSKRERHLEWAEKSVSTLEGQSEEKSIPLQMQPYCCVILNNEPKANSSSPASYGETFQARLSALVTPQTPSWKVLNLLTTVYKTYIQNITN